MKLTLTGAGGKMGLRIARNLMNSNYQMSYLEINSRGREALMKLNLSTSREEEVIPDSDIVILAVPDNMQKEISRQIVPKMKPGSMLFTLDPACALAGKLVHRDDLNYVIAHPCHPSVFNWEPSAEAQKDFFGGESAKQSVVCALFHGKESAYAIGEQLARNMYAPVKKVFRITADQMGLLEPALVETLCSTLQVVVREGLEKVIEKGVPPEAAKEFLLGHINIQLAVLYDQIPGAVFSDAANKAIERGKPLLVQKDWEKVFDEDNVREQINDII